MSVVNCEISPNVTLWHPDLVNLYGCVIGDNCSVAAFVEIGKNVWIGARVRIGSHVFIPEGVVVEDDVFIGPGVTFCNDLYPPSGDAWKQRPPTVVRRYAALGARAVILPGVEIGEGALVGAGAVVLHNVPAGACVVGNPARICGERKHYVDA